MTQTDKPQPPAADPAEKKKWGPYTFEKRDRSDPEISEEEYLEGPPPPTEGGDDDED